MPWGLPDAPPAYCPGCGRTGHPFLERRRVAGALAWLRTCVECYTAGWRLVGERVEPGGWWTRQGGRSRASVLDVSAGAA